MNIGEVLAYAGITDCLFRHEQVSKYCYKAVIYDPRDELFPRMAAFMYKNIDGKYQLLKGRLTYYTSSHTKTAHENLTAEKLETFYEDWQANYIY